MFNGESAEPEANGARHRAASEEESIPLIGARSKAKELAREVTTLRAEVERLRADLDRLGALDVADLERRRQALSREVSERSARLGAD